MIFNLVVMLMGLGVGYFSQTKWIFILAVVIFVYRLLEANYFITQYPLTAKLRYDKSTWATVTVIAFLIWCVYLLYRIVDILFQG